MKKLSKKSLVLFAGVMAVCALAMPAMASALSWAPVGGADHALFSSNLQFSSETPNAIGSSCASSSLTGVVDNAATLTVTASAFTSCRGILGATNCTATPVGSNFPWTVTATNPLQIHNIHVTVHLENTPGGGPACAVPITITLTGTLTGGTFNNVEHGVTLASATGLVGHPGPLPVTVAGTLIDNNAANRLTLS